MINLKQMERYRSSEVDRLVTELATIARNELETPDGITTKMYYSRDLPDSYNMSLESRADSEAASYKQGSNYHTAVFIQHVGEVHDEDHCSTHVVFSCLYDHAEQMLHGMQLLPPTDLPCDIPQGTNLESTTLQRTLAIAEYIYDNDLKTKDSDFEGYFSLRGDEISTELSDLVTLSLESINQLLAEGAFHERRFKSIGSDASSLWIKSNVSSGPSEHADNRNRNNAQLSISFTEDGITYTFEQTANGVFEIKSKIADFAERYRYFRTFKPIFNEETGELIVFGINGKEIEEKDQAEREAGMYEPTAERLHAFLERLRSAA